MKSKNFDYYTKIRIEFDDPNECNVIGRSIKVDKQKFKRSKSSINIKNNTLLINIFATDPKALKATFNTYLKLISILYKIWRMIK